MQTIEELQAEKQKIHESAQRKKAELDKKIRQARTAERRAKVAEQAIAEAHIKHALGGACLAALKNPDVSKTVRAWLLAAADAGVTNDSENLARQMFDEFKNNLKHGGNNGD